jgi:hypothetical protein
MFSGKVTSLAGLRLGVLTRMIFAAVGGIEMTHGGRAVAIGGDGQAVNVVDEGAVGCFGGKAGEVYGKKNAGTVGVCGAGDGASD